MAVPDAKEKWSGRVNTVTIGATAAEGGTRGRTVTIGGQSGIPFLSFDGDLPHPPAIAIDVLDMPPVDWPQPLAEVYGDVWSDPAAWARRVKELGADLVNLRLAGTHPDEGDRSPEQAVETVKAVLEARRPAADHLGLRRAGKGPEGDAQGGRGRPGRELPAGRGHRGRVPHARPPPPRPTATS